MKPIAYGPISAAFLLLGCSDNPNANPMDTSDSMSSPSDSIELPIVPGVGIGPITLGLSYETIYADYGEPDALIDYNRVYLATWMELGVEAVFGSRLDDAVEDEAQVVSVGTRLPKNFTGVVVPGMTRAEADAALGECVDVIDDVHCYHEAGVYLAYDANGLIETVAIHPTYSVRSTPPKMQHAQGLGAQQ